MAQPAKGTLLLVVLGVLAGALIVGAGAALFERETMLALILALAGAGTGCAMAIFAATRSR